MEVSSGHMLSGQSLKVLAKREDQDDILISNDRCFFVVHLTWTGKVEKLPYPNTELYESMEQLNAKLEADSVY